MDIDNGGYGYVNGVRQLICNVPLSMNETGDFNHTYWTGWRNQYHNGAMDGFCQQPGCLQYPFVDPLDVDEYFQIATAYGFANYIFQTNEGLSCPAHQFLFTGTSAPVAPPNPGYKNLVAENSNFFDSGCPTNEMARGVNPAGQEGAGPVDCYPHDSLVS